MWQRRALTRIYHADVHAAKNVILAGVRAVTIHDTKAATLEDLSTQFYITVEDVGKNRAESCQEKLQELNTAVKVTASTAELTDDFMKQFQVCDMHSTAGVSLQSTFTLRTTPSDSALNTCGLGTECRWCC